MYVHEKVYPFFSKSECLKMTYFWNSHSLLSRGHTWRVFNQRDIQWKWNACWNKK